MARGGFTAGNYISGAVAPSGVYPFPQGSGSVFVWAQHDSLATAGCAYIVSQGSSPERSASMYFRGDVGGDPLQFRYVSPTGSSVAANSAAGYSINAWTACGGKTTSTTDATVYRDNNATTASGTVNAIAVPDKICIGANVVGAAAEPIGGPAAMAAWWNEALTDAEWTSLYKGFSPRRIRPHALISYSPLVRNIQDLTGRFSPSATGTPTVVTHPRTYGL